MRKLAIALFIITATAGALAIAVMWEDRDGVTPTHKAASVEALRSVPYVTWAPMGQSEGMSGVTVYDEDRTYPGLNLYTSRNLARAFLRAMDGNLVHSWATEIDPKDTWQHVEPAGGGDILAIVKDKRLLRLGWDSQIRWSAEGRFHHDLVVDSSGLTLALTRADRVVLRSGVPHLILDDLITVLDSEGKTLDVISIYDVLKDRIDPGRFEAVIDWTLSYTGLKSMLGTFAANRFLVTNGISPDLLHTNSIEEIHLEREGVCRKGDLLLSVCELDLVVILDRDTWKVKWEWGPGVISKQHHPTQLANGNLLIFDNGVEHGRSRVIELDPGRKEIVWEYRSDPPESFFSLTRGAAQRLPNGNTLITESDKGRVFEIDRDGRLVWEFFNPQTRATEKQRAAIYRMLRVGREGWRRERDSNPRDGCPST